MAPSPAAPRIPPGLSAWSFHLGQKSQNPLADKSTWSQEKKHIGLCFYKSLKVDEARLSGVFRGLHWRQEKCLGRVKGQEAALGGATLGFSTSVGVGHLELDTALVPSARPCSHRVMFKAVTIKLEHSRFFIEDRVLYTLYSVFKKNKNQSHEVALSQPTLTI